MDAGGVPNVDLPATVRFLFKETSSDILSLPLIETSAIVLTFDRNNVVPLTSRANDDEMSLLIATELVPEPSFTFWLRDMSLENAVGPLNAMLDPLNVSAPAAEMSTVVDAPFTILIASLLPMVMIPVEADPVPILIAVDVTVASVAPILIEPEVIPSPVLMVPAPPTRFKVAPVIVVVPPVALPPIDTCFDVEDPVPILIAPLLPANVPILRVPLVCVVAMSICDATFETSILFTVRVFVTLAVPETSKLNAGANVFTPTYPEPPAAYKEILSAVAAAVGSFSIPMVKRPILVVAPEPSWYFMYA